MLLTRIELHMRRTRISASRFGRDAVGDPNLVMDIKDGRELRSATRRKVLAFIAAREAELNPGSVQ